MGVETSEGVLYRDGGEQNFGGSGTRAVGQEHAHRQKASTREVVILCVLNWGNILEPI